MNQSHRLNLPSISTLLSDKPPMIVIQDEDKDTIGVREQYYISNTLSPILSPSDSNNLAIESPRTSLSPRSPSMLTLPFSPIHNSSQLLYDDLLKIPQRRVSIESNKSYEPQAPPSPLFINNNYSQQEDTKPSNQSIFSDSGKLLIKRKRGRPPRLRDNSVDGGWTFITPTVWDVTKTTDLEECDYHDSIMNGSMAAFSSLNTNTLGAACKKRGRKSKHYTAGNSCFVWKDVAAIKRSTKKIQEKSIKS